jgi:hypothetical protein
MAKWVDVKFDTSKVVDFTRSKKKAVQQLPKRALEKFKAVTPVRTGRARRSTRLSNQTIHADYPYAQKLDEGHSKQAPQGMTKPTEAWVRKEFKKIFKK